MLKLKKGSGKTQKEIQLDSLKAELKECSELLKRSEDKFQFAVDEHLIEAQIYEIKCLAKHRDYLISQIKAVMYENNPQAGLREIV